MNVFCVRSLRYSFNSYSNTEGYVINDCIYVVVLPTEVMFCGLLRVSQASTLELVFGVFIVGPGSIYYPRPPLIFLFMCPLYIGCSRWIDYPV